MKLRSGFVSNSSSSSFVVKEYFVPIDLREKLQEAVVDNCKYYDYWTFEIEDDFFFGRTDMDNFSAVDFLVENGVPREVIVSGEWLEDYMREEASIKAREYLRNK